MGDGNPAKPVRDPRFPFGDWETLRSNFLSRAEHNRLVADQLTRSSATAAEVVGSPEAWLGLTPITKADIIQDQVLDPPYGQRRSVGLDEIGLVLESSGSTGKGREVHYLSQGDITRTATAWAQYLIQMGVTSRDVVALCFPIGMAGGGIRHMLAYSQLGAKVLRVGALPTERKIEAIRYYRASTLVATPAYVDRLAVVTEELGLPPSELGIRRIVVATQSVSVEWVRATEAMWGARLYEWYGTSAGIAAFACARGMADGDGRGTLHWDPQITVHEVLDVDSGQPVADGEHGELVGTPLINEAEPMFRFATGDLVRYRAPGSCPCSSSWPGIESGTVRRLDHSFKVKGVSLSPATVDAVVLGRPEVLDYRARIWQDGGKREQLAIELLTQSETAEDLAVQVAGRLRTDTGLSFAVTVTGERSSWSLQTSGEAGKAKRWVDERAGAS
jgi:phenylacetate-CoA ligase